MKVGDARKTQVSFVERARSNIFIQLYSQKVLDQGSAEVLEIE